MPTRTRVPQALTAAADDVTGGSFAKSVKSPSKRKVKRAHDEDNTERRCLSCGTSETPKWRCGMTMCNACGLRTAKRATQARAPATRAGRRR